MSIGYACLALGVPYTGQKTCTMKNADEARLMELILNNLNSLENIILYNIDNNIKLFRISSDLIPFGSSPVNRLPWWDIFEYQLKQLGQRIKDSGMRVSMHPGQYTVLNSPDEEVLKRAEEDLEYHSRVLDSLQVGAEHKLVLHIGGVYSDKKESTLRFIKNYRKLSEGIRHRLVIENDDKSYNVRDVLDIGTELGIPVVFDALHDQINPYDAAKSCYYWIAECRKTWRPEDGVQKIHYSLQEPGKKPGSHSNSITAKEFLSFYNGLEDKDLDIMLEVKDKNISAVKCINCTGNGIGPEALEREWSRYGLLVLERAPTAFEEIEGLLRKDSDGDGSLTAFHFYELLEKALQQTGSQSDIINAAQRVWVQLSSCTEPKDKDAFFRALEAYRQGKGSAASVKNLLYKLALSCKKKELLSSYYFC